MHFDAGATDPNASTRRLRADLIVKELWDF
jgi:hypothetical protein